MKIKVKYLSDKIIPLSKIEQGDWIDLRASEELYLNRGDFALIPLGMAVELPKGYEAHIVPRSSTFKNFGIIQTNGMGVVDESYCGDNDQWFMPVYATRFIKINTNDRICQFRIVKKMPEIEIETVDKLGNDNRGGHGSTGIT